ncbi:MAG: hypothetical protein KJ044_16720, partial [Planctomycetes bacterium]|nr:hypothetical protein [Planctomycetota bacterium]
MTRLLVVVLLLFAAGPLLAQKPIKVEWREVKYPSGKLKEKYAVQVDKNGRETRFGDAWEYHENGAKAAEGKYHDGKKEGRWRWYYETGQLREEGLLAQDVRWKTWTSYHPNGKKRQEGDYDAGKRTGKWTWWYANTKKREESGYKDDKRDGRFQQWHETGQKSVDGKHVADQRDGT